MHAAERRLIAALGLLPPGPVPCGRLERLLAPDAGRAEVRIMLNRLAAAGDVVLLRNVSGDRFVSLPPDPDKIASLRQAAFGPLPPCAQPVRRAERGDAPDLAADMVTLAGLAADERPAPDKKGKLPKRIAQNWSRRLTLAEEAGRRIAGERRAMLDVPGNVAVVLDLALRAGLAQMSGGKVEPDASGFLRWMQKEDGLMRREAYYLFLQAFPPEHPLARHVAWLLPDVPAGAWVSCGEAERAWRRALADLRLDAGDMAGWTDALRPLREAGWLEIGETRDGRPALRPARPLARSVGGRPADGPDGPLYVQPDFELFVPSGGSYALHGLLTGFAEPSASGRMNVYRLTAQSVKRALGRGWTRPLMLDVLKRHAAGRVPEEVARGLADWEREFGAVKAEPAVLVTFACAEAAEALEAAGTAGLPPGADRRLGPGVFVLRETEWEAFRRAAEKLGFRTPDIPIPASREGGTDADVRARAAEVLLAPGGQSAAAPHDGDAGSERPGAPPETGIPGARPGLFSSPFALDGYRPAPNWTPDELYPGLGGVPAVWRNERFAGHPATKLRLLRLALEWGCRVEAGLAAKRRTACGDAGGRTDAGRNDGGVLPATGGQAAGNREIVRPDGEGGGTGRENRPPQADGVTFLVTELAETDGAWRIGGIAPEGEIRLMLEELEDLKLVLPGISDGGT